VLGKLDKGMRTATVGCHCVEKKLIISLSEIETRSGGVLRSLLDHM
jgi:hypothetical protein